MNSLCYVRSFLYVLFLISFQISIKAQTTDVNTYSYFEGFSPAQKKVITNNWNQFFRTNVYKEIDPENKNVFQIKLDSYGSIYPDYSLFEGVDFEPFCLNKKNLYKYSLFSYFTSKSNRVKIGDNIKSESLNHQYNDIIKLFDSADTIKLNKRTLKCNKKPVRDLSEGFYQKWDSLHFDNLVKSLNNKIRSDKYTDVLFFIHGYNVPFGLANVQLFHLNRLISDTLNVTDKKILYVPIFWSSNDQKKKGQVIFTGMNIE